MLDIHRKPRERADAALSIRRNFSCRTGIRRARIGSVGKRTVEDAKDAKRDSSRVAG